MKAEIEPISGVIRVWVDGGVYGDPYEWVATVRWLSRDKIEILGYTTKVTPSIWKAVIKECQRLGIVSILAVSYKDRQRKEKIITVPSPFQSLYR
jgi:hypothetical protein